MQRNLSGLERAKADILAQNGDYKPKNILLTGGAGFIGSHTAILLAEKYPHYNIVVLDKLDYCASRRNLDAIASRPNFRFVKGDIQSTDLVAYVLQTNRIDTVLHFAAQTHVDNSFGNSLAFTMNNTYGTHTLLEACRVYGRIRRFINVSTDEVYGEASLGASHGLDETSSLEPTNPYSAAKAGAEMMVRAYMTSYRMPVIVTRGNNVYGPHQFPEKLIPKFALLASRNADLPVHGDGNAVRSYLHVADVARAFDCILHKGQTGTTYNVGTQKERSVLDVAHDICALFQLPESHIVHVPDRPFNDQRYFISNEALLDLGWQEETSWEDGLRDTIAWYLKVGFGEYWENGSVEAALSPHPTLAAVGGLH